MPEIPTQDKQILDEIKVAVGDITPLSLVNRFPFCSASALNEIEDYCISECNKREDFCIESLLKAAGGYGRPAKCANFEDICEFAIQKIREENL